MYELSLKPPIITGVPNCYEGEEAVIMQIYNTLLTDPYEGHSRSKVGLGLLHHQFKPTGDTQIAALTQEIRTFVYRLYPNIEGLLVNLKYRENTASRYVKELSIIISYGSMPQLDLSNIFGVDFHIGIEEMARERVYSFLIKYNSFNEYETEIVIS
jgi:hypothetical protein